MVLKTRCTGTPYQISANQPGLVLHRPGKEKTEVNTMSSRTIAKWIKDSKYHFCAACGSEDDLQYHHLVPISRGGTDEPSNIIVLCAVCHQKWHQQGGSDHHNHLVKDGIAEAKKRGVRVGKPPLDYEKVMKLIAEYSTQFNEDSITTEHEIMDMAEIKPVSYAKCKRMLLSAMQEEVWPYSWDKPVQVRKHPLYDHCVKRMRGEMV